MSSYLRRSHCGLWQKCHRRRMVNKISNHKHTWLTQRILYLNSRGSTSGKNKEKDLAQSLQQAVLRIKNGNTICGESEVSKNYCAIGVNMNANACYGDSGSPLMFWDQRWYVFGLTSFILSDNSTCVTGLPSYYTVVPSYLSWIGNVVTAMEIS